MSSKSSCKTAALLALLTVILSLFGCGGDPIKLADKPLLNEQAQKKAQKRAEEQNN